MSKKEKMNSVFKTIGLYALMGALLAFAGLIIHTAAKIPERYRFNEYLEQHKELNQQINRLEKDTVAWRKRYRAMGEEIQVRNERGMDYREIAELYSRRSTVGLQIQRNEALLENLILVANELRAKYGVKPRTPIYDCTSINKLRYWNGNC